MDVEMNLEESHSVQTMSGSASAISHDQLVLISSSASTASPSSSPSSPLHNSSLSKSSTVPLPSPPPPPLDPQQLQVEQSCIVSIAFAPSNPGTCPTPPSYLTREEAFRSIRESTPHSMKLDRLLASERGYQKEASSYKKAVRRQSKDLYVIVSMYAVLQGAIFTAVAQSSIFTCADRWGPASIVGAVTLGTVIAALDKLHGMGKKREQAERSQRCQNAVYSKIMLLYDRGSLCEIEALEPSHNVKFRDDAGRMFIFSARGLLVLGFLLGFSALMIVSCTLMLTCPACRCHG